MNSFSFPFSISKQLAFVIHHKGFLVENTFPQFLCNQMKPKLPQLEDETKLCRMTGFDPPGLWSRNQISVVHDLYRVQTSI